MDRQPKADDMYDTFPMRHSVGVTSNRAVFYVIGQENTLSGGSCSHAVHLSSLPPSPLSPLLPQHVYLPRMSCLRAFFFNVFVTQLHPGEYGFEPSAVRSRKRTAPDDDGDDSVAPRRLGEASGVDSSMDVEEQALGAGLAPTMVAPPVPEGGERGGGASASAEVGGGEEEDILSFKDKEIAVGCSSCLAAVVVVVAVVVAFGNGVDESRSRRRIRAA